MANTTKKDLILSQRGIPQGSGQVPGKLNFSIVEDDDQAILGIEVPGVDPETIEMEAYSDSIRVSCELGDMDYPVNASLDLSKIDVSVRWGLLQVVIPRRQSRPLKIKINDK
jgi:HSP20 family molecular chaperone IbpA